MNKRSIIFISAIIVLFILLGLSIRYKSKKPASPTNLRSITIAPDNLNSCTIKSLEKIGPGWYPKWHPKKDLLVFNKGVGPLGIQELFTAKPDGSEERCLTCNKDIPGTFKKWLIHGHRGEPAWHPSGDYLVFLATNENGDFIKGLSGIGSNNDVFITTADGSKFWQITNIEPHRGLGGPAFSHDGTKIEWLEEYSCERQTCPEPYLTNKECSDLPYEKCRCCAPLDERSLLRGNGEDFLLLRNKIADITFGPDGPLISNIQTIVFNHEGKRMLDHGSGFTPNDEELIFKAADINETNGRPFCADIYTSNLNGDYTSFKRLTKSPLFHEENSTISPDGRKIAYTSGPLVGYVFFKLDLYLMDSDGTNNQRLTYFNESGSPEFDNQLHSVGEGSWSNDGTKYIFQVHSHHSKKINFSDWSGNFCDGKNMDKYGERIKWQNNNFFDIYLNVKTNLYMITFTGACGKE